MSFSKIRQRILARKARIIEEREGHIVGLYDGVHKVLEPQIKEANAVLKASDIRFDLTDGGLLHVLGYIAGVIDGLHRGCGAPFDPPVMEHVLMTFVGNNFPWMEGALEAANREEVHFFSEVERLDLLPRIGATLLYLPRLRREPLFQMAWRIGRSDAHWWNIQYERKNNLSVLLANVPVYSRMSRLKAGKS